MLTTNNQVVKVISVGEHNQLAGPDFFNATLTIDGQKWAGTVEIHLKSSDWFVHGHETDANYDNVILHVVWEDNIDVFYNDGTAIPCLPLKDKVDLALLATYQRLMTQKPFVNCQEQAANIDDFVWFNWMQRLFVERLEQKSALIFQLLKDYNNDWEKVLFCLLMKNFGLNHNGEVFLDIAKKIDFSVFRKVSQHSMHLESLLLGMAGLLNEETDTYCLQLFKEFQFQKAKFKLSNQGLRAPNFYGLRPNNFPTIRLSQLAQLYAKQQSLFQQVISCNDLETLHQLFNTATSEYWQTHYVFGKVGKKSIKKLSKSFIQLLVINTIVPIKFCHAKYLGKDNDKALFDLMEQLPAESNSLVTKFKQMGVKCTNALESQAIIQLHAKYCSKNQCLKCAIGNKLLYSNH